MADSVYSGSMGVRRILVRGVNAPLPPAAKKIVKIWLCEMVHSEVYLNKYVVSTAKDPCRLHFLFKNWLIDGSFVFRAKLHSCKISLIQTQEKFFCSKMWESAEWKFSETKDEMIFPETVNYPSLDMWQVDDASAGTMRFWENRNSSRRISRGIIGRAGNLLNLGIFVKYRGRGILAKKGNGQ